MTIISLWALFEAYFLGFATSFTPCVYPLIPVTLAIFGATADSSRLRNFLLALCYVAGMALTYTVLGLMAARGGAVFGSALGNPWVAFPIAALLVYLGLSCLEVVNLPGVHAIQSRTGRLGGAGFVGAFLMGLVSGLVAAPCIGPSLALVLTKAAAAESPAEGAILLSAYSFGLGTLFLLIALFPQALKALPRSGNWLLAVKFLLASAVLAAALLLLLPFLGPQLDPLLASSGLLTMFGLVSIGLAQLAYRSNAALSKVAAACLLALPLLSLARPAPVTSGQVSAGLSEPASTLSHANWLTSIEAGLEHAKQRNTIVFVDLFADWCTACKELDAVTFTDKGVQAALSSLVLVRLDFTDTSTPENAAISEKYAIFGLPSLLFLQANGEEIPDSRITGFLDPKQFTEHLEKVRSRLTSALALAPSQSANTLR